MLTIPTTSASNKCNAALRHVSVLSVVALPLFFLGCKSAPTPGPTNAPTNTPPAKVATFPTRPTVPPPPFKVFNHSQSSFTLTTKETASDDEIESLIWQLRDAARTRTLDKLKINQKSVDTDGMSVWFHIYRGTKCAAEKYASGPPPCGGSYHAAGDYTWSNDKSHPWDSGVLVHGEDREVSLWNPDAPYTAPTPESSAAK